MSDDASIRLMPLYTHLERIESGLAAQGIGPRDAIPPERLFRLDQWHCHGTEAICAAAEQLGLGPGSRVLDVGSGIGGLARYREAVGTLAEGEGEAPAAPAVEGGGAEVDAVVIDLDL